MSRFTIFAKCSISHFCSLKSVRNVTCGEWTGIASFDSKAKAEAWLASHRAEYKEYDCWSIN